MSKMATLKQRLHRKSESGSYDVVHLESDATVIKINSDDAETKTVADYLPKIQDTDDTPTDINPGQIIVGHTKVWFCGGDGETYELTSQGGSWFPQYGKNFTYTGEYVIVPENDTDWKVKFLTSGTFTATDALLIDVFAVGGGGGGYYNSSYSSSINGGGGGGYTKTEKSLYLEKNKNYEIIIGSGGSYGNNGGATSGFNVTANGGYTGTYQNTTTNKKVGGDGGSGGGGKNSGSTFMGYAGNGGSDGSDGPNMCGTRNESMIGVGKGQGTTTREFGETTGDLYAGGGGCGTAYASGMGTEYPKGGEGGGGNGAVKEYSGSSSSPLYQSPTAGDANTGGGGGGGTSATPGGAGGSGILIIRNHRE